jgi:6-phosphogluconolactonase
MNDKADPATEQPTPATEPRPEPRSGPPPWVAGPPQIHRHKDPEAVAEAAAKCFQEVVKKAVDRDDRAIVVLAGGSTPKALYRRLTEPPYRTGIPWAKTLFAFGDERCVPPDHEDSNYRMVLEALLGPLEIPDHHVLRMKGEQDPATAARRYAVRLGDLFLYKPRKKFDLVLLGIGTDGHTASLFPGTAALGEEEKWVAANEVPKLDAWRLTLTLPALNAAQRVVFLATGEAKARVVAEAFGGLPHDEPHPCERVKGSRRDLFVDRAAAAEIPKPAAKAE